MSVIMITLKKVSNNMSTIKTIIQYDEENNFVEAEVTVRLHFVEKEYELINVEYIEGKESQEFLNYLEERLEDIYSTGLALGDTEENIAKENWENKV